MAAPGRPNPRRKWDYSFVWMEGAPGGTSYSNTIQCLDAAGWELVSMFQTVSGTLQGEGFQLVLRRAHGDRPGYEDEVIRLAQESDGLADIFERVWRLTDQSDPEHRGRLDEVKGIVFAARVFEPGSWRRL